LVIASGITHTPRAATCWSPLTRLLAAGAAAGTVRTDVEPGDVLAGLSGVSLAAGGPGPRDQARRLLDLLMDGLRYRTR
jgi:hypothetical protein